MRKLTCLYGFYYIVNGIQSEDAIHNLKAEGNKYYCSLKEIDLQRLTVISPLIPVPRKSSLINSSQCRP